MKVGSSASFLSRASRSFMEGPWRGPAFEQLKRVARRYCMLPIHGEKCPCAVTKGTNTRQTILPVPQWQARTALSMTTNPVQSFLPIPSQPGLQVQWSRSKLQKSEPSLATCSAPCSSSQSLAQPRPAWSLCWGRGSQSSTVNGRLGERPPITQYECYRSAAKC